MNRQERDFRRERLPKSFTYIQNAAINLRQIPLQTLQDILFNTDDMSSLGQKLVLSFGAGSVRRLASEVDKLAQTDLTQDPTNKVAKSAARWAKRAQDRTQGNTWINKKPVSDSLSDLRW